MPDIRLLLRHVLHSNSAPLLFFHWAATVLVQCELLSSKEHLLQVLQEGSFSNNNVGVTVAGVNTQLVGAQAKGRWWEKENL